MRVTFLVSSHVDTALPLADAWRRAGDRLTLVLLDAASAAARPGHPCAGALAALGQAGVTLGAHDDALRRRALTGGSLVDGVTVLDLDDVADLVVAGERTVWW